MSFSNEDFELLENFFGKDFRDQLIDAAMPGDTYDQDKIDKFSANDLMIGALAVLKRKAKDAEDDRPRLTPPFYVDYEPGGGSGFLGLFGPTSFDHYYVRDVCDFTVAACLSGHEANQICLQYNSLYRG